MREKGRDEGVLEDKEYKKEKEKKTSDKVEFLSVAKVTITIATVQGL